MSRLIGGWRAAVTCGSMCLDLCSGEECETCLSLVCFHAWRTSKKRTVSPVLLLLGRRLPLFSLCRCPYLALQVAFPRGVLMPPWFCRNLVWPAVSGGGGQIAEQRDAIASLHRRRLSASPLIASSWRIAAVCPAVTATLDPRAREFIWIRAQLRKSQNPLKCEAKIYVELKLRKQCNQVSHYSLVPLKRVGGTRQRLMCHLYSSSEGSKQRHKPTTQM